MSAGGVREVGREQTKPLNLVDTPILDYRSFIVRRSAGRSSA